MLFLLSTENVITPHQTIIMLNLLPDPEPPLKPSRESYRESWIMDYE